MAILMALSVGLLWATSLMFTVHPIIPLVAGIAPLCWYHLKELAPRAESGLPQATIDSVYYFGFLITVAALIVSAFTIGKHGASESMDTVVAQFGTGLCATAYAVVARLHLQSRATGMTETTMEEVMDKYVLKSAEMVGHLDAASARLSEFSREIVSRTIEAAELTRLAANDKMLAVADEFSEQMADTLESARQGVHEFRVVLNSTAFAAERQQYTDSLKETVQMTANLNKAIGELVTKTREEVAITEQKMSASTNLGLRLSELALQVSALGGPKGAMTQSAASLKKATDSVTDAQNAIAGTVSALGNILDTVGDSGSALKTIRTVSKRATDQIDALSASSERAGQAALQVGDLADSTKILVRRVKSLDAVVESLSSIAGSLASNLGKAEAASSTFEGGIARLPRQAEAVEAFGARVEKSLAAIAARTEATLSTSEILADHSASARTTLEGATRLLDSAATLEGAIDSLQKRFGDLGKSVTGAQHTIHEAATDVKARLAESSHVLDDDIRRSAAAAARMNGLVETAKS